MGVSTHILIARRQAEADALEAAAQAEAPEAKVSPKPKRSTRRKDVGDE